MADKLDFLMPVIYRQEEDLSKVLNALYNFADNEIVNCFSSNLVFLDANKLSKIRNTWFLFPYLSKVDQKEHPIYSLIIKFISEFKFNNNKIVLIKKEEDVEDLSKKIGCHSIYQNEDYIIENIIDKYDSNFIYETNIPYSYMSKMQYEFKSLVFDNNILLSYLVKRDQFNVYEMTLTNEVYLFVKDEYVKIEELNLDHVIKILE